MKKEYQVQGMHCEGCAAKIAAALDRVEGVDRAEVSYLRRQATVEMQRRVELDRLNSAVRSLGNYTLTPQSGKQANGQSAAPASRAAARAGASQHDQHDQHEQHDQQSQPAESLFPLVLVVSYISGTVLLVAVVTGNWSADALMRYFMAGFFLVFSFFKLLDLRGFVSAFREYDLIARPWAAWAWAYPFVELALGIAYLLALVPVVTNVVTLAVMSVGAAGVLQALLNRRRIRCACLGTALNLPMTKVTLVEDLTMAAMAAAMLLMMAF